LGENFPQLEEVFERLKKLKAELIEKIIEKYKITHVLFEAPEFAYTTTDYYKDILEVLKKYNVKVSYLDEVEYWLLNDDERENKWVEKLSKIENGNVLIICGYYHAISLARKIKKIGTSDEVFVLPSPDPLYHSLLVMPIFNKLAESDVAILNLARSYNIDIEGYGERRRLQDIEELKNWLKSFFRITNF